VQIAISKQVYETRMFNVETYRERL